MTNDHNAPRTLHSLCRSESGHAEIISGVEIVRVTGSVDCSDVQTMHKFTGRVIPYVEGVPIKSDPLWFVINNLIFPQRLAFENKTLAGLSG